MNLALGRIVSGAAAAALWALLGVRLVLDAVGYSTIPDDLPVAATRLGQFLDWIVGVPLWAVLGVALFALAMLMFVSWPRPVHLAPSAASGSAPDRAVLRLAFRPGHGPEEVRSENVYRWYGLSHLLPNAQVVSYSVFVAFDKPISNRHSRVTADPPVKRMMINDQTDRYAIITIPGGPPQRLDLESQFSARIIPK
jgi:hypothetical protein